LPTYNEEKRIGRCLESIRNLRYPKEKLEVLVIDDGSEDKTVDIIRNNGLIPIQQNHLGCSSARNKGAECSRGDVLAFIDADDTCRADWLSESIAYLKDPRVAAIGSSHNLLNKDRTDFIIISYMDKAFRHNISPLKTNHVGACGTLIKKEIFDKLGGFNPRLFAAEDTELSSRIIRAGYDIILLKKPLISVSYPESVIRYMLNQVRNSKYHAYFLLKNPRSIPGNKYSGLIDYFQCLFPGLIILSIILFGIHPLQIILIIFLLILVNLRFFAFIMSSNLALSNLWFFSFVLYLMIRSLAWNIGLIYGIFLRTLGKPVVNHL
jgi:cellulose synthase/poly-beta-1,6-N-acetylglucosamine synthase-like glycosyltransferase